MKTVKQVTLLDLVQAVMEYASTDVEVVATVATLVNSGKVRLCGNFAAAHIDLDADDPSPSWFVDYQAAA